MAFFGTPIWEIATGVDEKLLSNENVLIMLVERIAFDITKCNDCSSYTKSPSSVLPWYGMFNSLPLLLFTVNCP